MGNYLLLSGHYIWWDFVYGKNGALQQMIDKKNPSLFI